MINYVRELIKYRELIYMMTYRDIRIKYKQSVMGFMWAILMPMLIVSAGILVKIAFSKISGVPMDPSQIATVSVKSLPWAFFISSLRFSTNCLTLNDGLVTKIYFPNEIFPISTVLSQLVDFAVASCVLILILAIAQIGLNVYILWVPVLLILLIILTVALSMFLAAANLFFRDVKYIVEAFVTFAIFFTPVFYESELAGKWEPLLLINPVAPILEGLNACVVTKTMPNIFWVSYSALISLALLFFTYFFFKKLEPTFAENI